MIEVRVTRHEMASIPREFVGHERLWLIQLLIERGVKFRRIGFNLQIDDLELIRPSTVTQYIEFRSQLGYTSHNFLGHLSSFFLWLTSTGQYDRGNPVVNRFHREQIDAMRENTSRHSAGN